MQKRDTTKCRNAPVCPKRVRKIGYCPSCSALRKLLSTIHKDELRADLTTGGEVPKALEIQARIDLHRRRASGVNAVRSEVRGLR